MINIDRYRGCWLGLAVGDALGTTLEFTTPGSFEPLTDMVGGGPFGLKAGQWTDDTAMAICLAESLIKCRGFDARDQMQRYVRWWREGVHSPTGRCFDIGNATSAALARFEQNGEPFAGSDDPQTAGNGSIMRLCPIPMFVSRRPLDLLQLAVDSSRTTHGARLCLDACRLFANLIAGALIGVSKDELLAPDFDITGGELTTAGLADEIQTIRTGSYKEKQPPTIRGTGFVVESLEAALWAFHSTDSFRAGALAAVNLGDDADTTGAVYGQLAGAHYGVDAIPTAWREKVENAGFPTAMADRLYELADNAPQLK